MNWAESPELLEIFLTEIDDRSERLISGAADLGSVMSDDDLLDELVRDAHTLKGSSQMIGKVDIGAVAAGLERVWKLLRDGRLDPDPKIAESLHTAAELLPVAARDASRRSELVAAADRLSLVAERSENGSAGAPRPLDEPIPIPSPTPLRDEDPVVASEAGTIDVSELTGSELGGLLTGLRDELSSTVTRVDTGDLYSLINRAVEIALETEALADLTHVSIDGADPERLLSAWRGQLERLASEVGELQTRAVSLANVPVGEATATFPQLARFLGRKLGKEISFEMTGTDVMVDRQIVDLIREPLRHLVVNAIDHGIEPADRRLALGKPPKGSVRLAVELRDERVVITVSDDGRGIDWDEVTALSRRRGMSVGRSEIESHLFRPDFTTVTKPTEFSGTGEGLALVADAADRIGGSVEIESEPDGGTKLTLDLPRSLILQDVVIVAVDDAFLALSTAAVLGSIDMSPGAITMIDGAPTVAFRGENVPVVDLGAAVGIPDGGQELDGLIVSTRSGLIAVKVDEIIDQRRVAVKSLGPILEGADHVTGAAFLGGGEVLVVVDHNHLGKVARDPQQVPEDRPRILVVDDSAGVRRLIAATLSSCGYDVVVAASARDAVVEMAEGKFDALVVDYSMPRSSGIQLVRALRSSGVDIPVVMVSAVATDEEKAAARRAGIDVYLDKYDLRRGALLTSVRRLLDEGTER